MEIEGTIVLDLPLQEGISKAGNAWKKKEWVLETGGMYPRKVKFHVFGNRVDELRFEVGKAYRISVDVESREFQGRWYTDVNAYAAQPMDMAAPQQPMAGGFGQPAAAPAFGQLDAGATPNFGTASAPAFDPLEGGNKSDDLPF